jgi:hypothetical protein
MSTSSPLSSRLGEPLRVVLAVLTPPPPPDLAGVHPLRLPESLQSAQPETPPPSANPQSAEIRVSSGQATPGRAYPPTNGNAGGKLPAGNATLRSPARSFAAA